MVEVVASTKSWTSLAGPEQYELRIHSITAKIRVSVVN
jgi:hypothetical protein